MTQLGPEVRGPEAGDYGVRLRRRWWVVVLGVLLGLAAALAYTAAQPTRYTSTTSVLVQSTGVTAVTSSTGTSRSDVNMDTEATLVSSEQVAQAAKGILKTATSATDLLADIGVVVPTNSQILQISYTDSTAKSAQAGAQAFGQAYLGYRASEAKKVLDGSFTSLQNELNDTQARLKIETDKIATLPPTSPDRTYAEANRTVLSSSISTLAARLSALQATSPTPGQIITDAATPSSPSSPNTGVNLAAGLVVGLLLGLALAMLADRLDHRLRSPSDVARRVGLPVLANVPKAADATSTAVFDRMRNTLTGSPEAAVRLLQVIDSGGRGASGVVALRLAESLGRSVGEATLVIASAASPVAGWASVAGRDGLSEVLRGEASLTDVRIPVVDLGGVWVVPAGRDPEGLEALLQTPELLVCIHDLLALSPAVVVETADTGRSAGAQALAAVSDITLLVAERGRADDRLVLASAQGAEQMGARVAGLVLADRAASRSSGASDGDGPSAIGSGRAARRRAQAAPPGSSEPVGSQPVGSQPVGSQPSSAQQVGSERVPAGTAYRQDRTPPAVPTISPATPQV